MVVRNHESWKIQIDHHEIQFSSGYMEKMTIFFTPIEFFFESNLKFDEESNFDGPYNNLDLRYHKFFAIQPSTVPGSRPIHRISGLNYIALTSRWSFEHYLRNAAYRWLGVILDLTKHFSCQSPYLLNVNNIFPFSRSIRSCPIYSIQSWDCQLSVHFLPLTYSFIFFK